MLAAPAALPTQQTLTIGTSRRTAALRRRRVWAHRNRTARPPRLAGRTRAGGGGLCRRAQYIAHAYRKRASCLPVSPVNGHRQESGARIQHMLLAIRTRTIRRLCSLSCGRCPCAVGSDVQQQRLSSRTAASTAETRTCAAVRRDQRASACSLVAFRAEIASLASIAQASPATIVKLTSRSHAHPA